MLSRLMCRVRGGKKELTVDARKEERKEKAASLKPDSAEVIAKQKEQLLKEKSFLDVNDSPLEQDFEEKFRKLVQSRKAGKGDDEEDDMVSKEDLKGIFKSIGIEFEEDLFEQVYRLFDADGDGMVNQTEFGVTMCLLMYRGSASNQLELCYRLFDTNRDEQISKREFNDMIASVMGNRLNLIVNIYGGHDAFLQFLKTEVHAEELLLFLVRTGWLSEAQGDGRPDMIPINVARAIYDEFVAEGGESQINVSHETREQVEKALEDKSDSDSVPQSIFHDCEVTAVQLIEDGPLLQFKKAIRRTNSKTNSYFADPAWNDLGMQEDQGLSLAKFTEWTEKTPNLFSFFDAISEVLELATVSARSGPA